MLKAINQIAYWIAAGHDRFRTSLAGRMFMRGFTDHVHEQISMHKQHAELLQ